MSKTGINLIVSYTRFNAWFMVIFACIIGLMELEGAWTSSNLIITIFVVILMLLFAVLLWRIADKTARLELNGYYGMMLINALSIFNPVSIIIMIYLWSNRNSFKSNINTNT